MTETQKVFIHNLKRLRKQQALSQMKLAELCSVSTSYVGEMEIGRKFPSVETFQRIANALKIKPYKLLMDEETREVLDREDFIRLLSETVKASVAESLDLLAAKYLTAEKTFPAAADNTGPPYNEKKA
jgi:transcriptional regulator with XRE-family HTH domain